MTDSYKKIPPFLPGSKIDNIPGSLLLGLSGGATGSAEEGVAKFQFNYPDDVLKAGGDAMLGDIDVGKTGRSDAGPYWLLEDLGAPPCVYLNSLTGCEEVALFYNNTNTIIVLSNDQDGKLCSRSHKMPEHKRDQNRAHLGNIPRPIFTTGDNPQPDKTQPDRSLYVLQDYVMPAPDRVFIDWASDNYNYEYGYFRFENSTIYDINDPSFKINLSMDGKYKDESNRFSAAPLIYGAVRVTSSFVNYMVLHGPQPGNDDHDFGVIPSIPEFCLWAIPEDHILGLKSGDTLHLNDFPMYRLGEDAVTRNLDVLDVHIRPEVSIGAPPVAPRDMIRARRSDVIAGPFIANDQGNTQIVLRTVTKSSDDKKHGYRQGYALMVELLSNDSKPDADPVFKTVAKSKQFLPEMSEFSEGYLVAERSVIRSTDMYTFANEDGTIAIAMNYRPGLFGWALVHFDPENKKFVGAETYNLAWKHARELKNMHHACTQLFPVYDPDPDKSKAPIAMMGLARSGFGQADIDADGINPNFDSIIYRWNAVLNAKTKRWGFKFDKDQKYPPIIAKKSKDDKKGLPFIMVPADLSGRSIILGQPALNYQEKTRQVLARYRAMPYQNENVLGPPNVTFTMMKTTIQGVMSTENKTWSVGGQLDAHVKYGGVRVSTHAGYSHGQSKMKMEGSHHSTNMHLSTSISAEDVIHFSGMETYTWQYPLYRAASQKEPIGYLTMIIPNGGMTDSIETTGSTDLMYLQDYEIGNLLTYLSTDNEMNDDEDWIPLFDPTSVTVPADQAGGSTISYDENNTTQKDSTFSWDNSVNGSVTVGFDSPGDKEDEGAFGFGGSVTASFNWHGMHNKSNSLTTTKDFNIMFHTGSVNDASMEYDIEPHVRRHKETGVMDIGYDVKLTGPGWKKKYMTQNIIMMRLYPFSKNPQWNKFTRSIRFRKIPDGLEVTARLFNSGFSQASDVTVELYTGTPVFSGDTIDVKNCEKVGPKTLDSMGPLGRDGVTFDVKELKTGTMVVAKVWSDGIEPLARYYWGVYPFDALPDMVDTLPDLMEDDRRP